jgi:hypothetical protein
MRHPVRSLREAAAFVNSVGLALVFHKDGVALPSLWEAIAGPEGAPFAEEREGGGSAMTPEARQLWAWKDELAAERLACAGKHVRGWPALVALALLPSLYALTGREGSAADFRDAVLSPLERDVAEAVLAADRPLTGPEIRRAVGRRDAAVVGRAIDSLQRALVLTRAGTVERETGWPAIGYDVLARRYGASLGWLPGPERARAELAATVRRAAGELSPAGLARALGFSRTEAEAALAG